MSRYLRPTVAFDVDDTLIGPLEEPREDVLTFLKLFHKFGCDVIVWSNGGGDHESSPEYADRICKKLGIDKIVRIIEKGSLQPDITIDDLEIWTRISEETLGRVNIKV